MHLLCLLQIEGWETYGSAVLTSLSLLVRKGIQAGHAAEAVGDVDALVATMTKVVAAAAWRLQAARSTARNFVR